MKKIENFKIYTAFNEKNSIVNIILIKVLILYLGQIWVIFQQ